MPSARFGAAESITRALSHGEQPLVLVRTVTGLERLAAAELTAANHRVIDLSKRQLIVRPTAATIITNPPRLADDLFVVQAAVVDPGRTRPALAAAVTAVRRQLCSGPKGRFAVSASFQGSRNFTRFDVEDLVGEVLQEISGSRYHSRRNGTAPPPERVDWRVVLDGTTMWVGVRPFDVPLHRREWRRQTVTGSLHPPVAAAMARLARIRPGHRVLDPFCGAGTLLLEAHAVMPGAIYLGVDKATIAVARANTPDHASIQWRTGDARRVVSEVDRILTNPPWDVRLGIGDLTPYLNRWRRVLHPDGRIVTILNHEQAARISGDAAWQILDIHDVAIAGQHPRIVIAKPINPG
ncbi:TRM11 family SAM-dependent methyltransferase [Kribbella sp. NPDC049174]|uniref:TRM11 family SAM-dependent methyltransferase n=1 Tax=Kribbella sp. NPDC049174 TaxID=3364112 RepID=UPI003713BE54